MSKYKLINTNTKEEHLCDKVTIDGFDYYVSDKQLTKKTKPCYCYNSIKNTWDEDIVFYQGVMPMYHYEGFKIIIATTDPNIDVPKVVDEVKKNLYFDKQVMNPYETGGQSYTAYEKGFIQGYNKAKETHPFTEEDMIEFAEWTSLNMSITPKKKTWYRYADKTDELAAYTTQELLQLWKEQQPKIIYYE